MPGSSLPLPTPREVGELARNVEFVRRLARALASDAATSDDLAQETWLATLERREAPAGSLRAWLTRVVRNRAALALRRGERRARRESARAQGETSASAAELVERMELHGRVVAAVLALPDDQREVVLRRHFEGLGTREIAEALHVPEPTVRTRLARAHELLRGRLRAHFGGDRGLLAVALARLADEGVPAGHALAPPLSPIALPLAMKKTLAALTLALLALVAVWSVSRSPRLESSTPAAPGSGLLASPALSAPSLARSAEPAPSARAPVAEVRSGETRHGTDVP